MPVSGPRASLFASRVPASEDAALERGWPIGDATQITPWYSGWRAGGVDIRDVAGGCGCPICSGASPADPQAFMAPTSGVAANGLPIYNWDQAAAQITRDSNGWAGLGNAAVVSYGFRASISPINMPSGTTGFLPFTAEQIAITEEILDLWSEVANITFVRVDDGAGYTNNATILFSNYSSGATGASAFAYYPGSTAAGASAGDVWVNFSLANNNSNLVIGAFGPHIIAHEIGHAIGLAHPANYDASDGVSPTYPASAVYWQDGRMFTVMSYFGSLALGGSLNAFAAGPQLHDIAAAQRLYGANMTTRTGDTVYGFNSNTGHAHFTITADGQSPVFAIWDAGGNDTIDFSGYSTSVEIDLREEAFSSAGPGNGGAGIAVGNIAIARGAVIESGIGGSGNDTLIGNAVENVLTGNAGADALNGNGGVDTARYAGSEAGVTVNLATGVGSGGHAQGDTLTNIENLDGSPFADTLTGDANANVISGLGGADILDGGLGADAMTGGDGNDSYYVDSVSDTLTEALNQGTDTVFASISFALGANIENLTLTGGDNINATGTPSANVLVGNTGNNILDGAGGVDDMTGGNGNDTYITDGSDQITEALDEGIDMVMASVSYALGANIENLVLTGSGVNGTGNDLNNSITGNSGANSLSGAAGGDTLNGMAGDDTIVGGLGSDTINGGDGNDTIVYAFGDGNDIIDGGADNDTLNASGSSADNVIQASWNGSVLAAVFGNTLSGIESINVDMGLGADTLLITATSGVSVNLGAGTATGFISLLNVENVFGGSGDDLLTGSNVANQIQGLGGADTLDGGAGNDIVRGGDGDDTIAASLGNDSLQGNNGNDTFIWAWGDGVDSANGGADNDTFSGSGNANDNVIVAVWDGVSLTGALNCSLISIEAVNVDMLGGVDTIIFTASASVSVNLALGTASGFGSLSGVENAIGGTGADTLTGNGGNNLLLGLAGSDTINGAAGADIIQGGEGDDSISGGAGNDSLQGNNGNDTFYWSSGDGADTMNGGGNFDTVNFTGSVSDDIFRAVYDGVSIVGGFNCALIGIEAVSADVGSGTDWLVYQTASSVIVNLSTGSATGFTSITSFENAVSDAGNDLLTGNGAANRLDGGLGADALDGAGGNDLLLGGGGDDVIMGGIGNDSLTGGSGSDRFVFGVGDGTDRINDFDADSTGGQDMIDLTGFGINVGDFNSRVTIVDLGNDTQIVVDGLLVINLTGVTGDGDNSISQADFILGP